MDARTVPPAFIAELKRRFGSGYDARYDLKKQRFVIRTPTMRGPPIEQVWGWFHDPTRSTWNATSRQFEHPPVPVDAETGLPPFRELDARAQLEILDAMEKTYLHNRHDGHASWAKRGEATQAYNQQLQQAAAKQRAVDYADMVTEFDIRRPGWLKTHGGSRTQRRVARSA